MRFLAKAKQRAKGYGQYSGKLFLTVFIFFIVGMSIVPADAKSKQGINAPPFVNAKAAIVYDATDGKILYGKNADQPVYPASTTKLMTAILLVTYLKPDDTIYVSEKASRQAKVRLGVKSGTNMRADDALHALLMKSANDVAYAVAETVGGSQFGFARMMNVKASLLGCTHTRFVTPNGLHNADHKSTAHDIALILAEAIRYPRIIAAMQATHVTIDGKPVRNGNRLLHGKPTGLGQVIGGKTGYTSKAMYCLAFAARQNGHVRISVVLGAPRKSVMYRETEKLLKWSASRRQDKQHITVISG